MSSQIENQIGMRIKILRKRTGLTQNQFAQKVGMPYESYRVLEKGRSLTWKNLETVTNVLECTVQDLLGEPGIKSSEELELDLTYRELVRTYPELVEPCHQCMKSLMEAYNLGKNKG
jgi:transcriptional regulator with XRE-family HTH domain